MEKQENSSFEYGIQPIDGIMEKMRLKNHDLVEVSSENITHKMVKKARSGRRLTPKIKIRITNALNIVRNQRDLKPFVPKKLFNY